MSKNRFSRCLTIPFLLVSVWGCAASSSSEGEDSGADHDATQRACTAWDSVQNWWGTPLDCDPNAGPTASEYCDEEYSKKYFATTDAARKFIEDCLARVEAHPPGCGDGVCARSMENEGNCAFDCSSTDGHCGNNICDHGEDSGSCPHDCGTGSSVTEGGIPSYCGDGNCDPSEDASSCAADCAQVGFCGDGHCDWNENSSICPHDCAGLGKCGDGHCDWNEDFSTCPSDC